MGFLKKPTEGAKTRSGSKMVLDADQKKRWPALTEYMSTTTWPDGTARQTSTLLLIVEEDVAKICLNDRDADRSCWMAGTSFLALLDGLEAALAKDMVEWRARPQGAKPKRR